MTRIPEIEYRVLAGAGSGVTVAELAEQAGVDQSLVAAGAAQLAARGLVTVGEEPYEEFSLSEAGLAAAASGLPERLALRAICGQGGRAALAGLAALLGKADTRAEVKWLTKKGWCSRDGGALVVTDAGRAALESPGDDERLLVALAALPDAVGREEDIALAGLDAAAALESLGGRTELLRRKRRVVRVVSLTEAGSALLAAGIEPAREVTQLDPSLLVSGKWREVILKQYDVTLAAAPRYPGKPHPLGRAVQETRRVFLEMGFEEARSPAVETAFWDFDALFQPQDHPAREMQDTFYMAAPKSGRLPDPALVERVRRAHEDGGDTGSAGWRYRWDSARAEQAVLRTHTTATTIRALAENPNPPRKVFSVGKVFRRENVDATHLPEFIQIDGIIIDEDANLATLFGTLREFYLKMGAKDVRFRPSFFPYTEPSVEAFAYLDGLGWVEMCGAGVFRPEVTRPLGCRVPVIAWGGGLERVAMMRFGLDDIRKLYWADIKWLREAALCR